MAVPTVYLNGEAFGQGRRASRKSSRSSIAARARGPRRNSTKTRVRYADRRRRSRWRGGRDLLRPQGHPTGVAAERFGGQVLDTLAIENFVSVQETEGPEFATALEQHVKSYDVDVMDVQRAEALVPGRSTKCVSPAARC